MVAEFNQSPGIVHAEPPLSHYEKMHNYLTLKFPATYGQLLDREY